MVIYSTNDTANVDFTVDIGWIRCQESLVSFCNWYIGHKSKLSCLKTSSNQTYIKTWSCSSFPWCLIIVQSLHTKLNNPQENSLTFEDFSEPKIVLISDEARHINVETKMGRTSQAEKKMLDSWENTVNRMCF